MRTGHRSSKSTNASSMFVFSLVVVVHLPRVAARPQRRPTPRADARGVFPLFFFHFHLTRSAFAHPAPPRPLLGAPAIATPSLSPAHAIATSRRTATTTTSAPTSALAPAHFHTLRPTLLSCPHPHPASGIAEADTARRVPRAGAHRPLHPRHHTTAGCSNPPPL
ncbi:hypothetical protein PLICRDRAFT_181012 [Plicaturopsis crispa FD-325 SS-3]|uniref:Uncharacterized protein n=1 Tax=Plicaturopsis crispa FD-325 SS-3 TaxID=944288 RepID=A0A0C9T0Z1_PLICR|nr:hypothetical protein PLICRDRAFT_181012 [Plicaturopsis crispa FD-325 SS-3]